MAVDRRSRGSRWLPWVYLLAAGLMVAVVLPSSLRPPPDEASQTAELSPDAPPDDEAETIIQSLQQAASRTAGASGETPVEVVETVVETTTTVPPPKLPPRGQCFGDPPRAIESVYAGPCTPAWVGDNGGNVSRGVTAEEIRFGLMMTDDLPEGRMETTSDNALAKSWALMAEYFSRNFELYGRKIVVYNAAGGDDAPGFRARARRLASEYQVFAGHHGETVPGLDEMAAQGIPTFHNADISVKYHQEKNPYLWTARALADDAVDVSSEYLCNKLAGRTPFPTGDPLMDYSSPRKFGAVIRNSDPPHQEPLEQALIDVKEQCGIDIDPVIRFDLLEADQVANGIAQMKTAGVTTIMYMHHWLALPVVQAAADNQNYYPEWFTTGVGGMHDVLIVTRGNPPAQMRNTYGISLDEIRRRPEEHECYRALKSIDPTFSPPEGTCIRPWPMMVQFVTAMTNAGPKLTTEAFVKGMRATPCRPPDPEWAMAGCYHQANDWSYSEYAIEMWWNATVTGADGGTGSWVYPMPLERWKLGELEPGEPRLYTSDFTSGRDIHHDGT